ncbi:hypothetical protein M408DRAFT_8343 [Serendipita vermifera MAFF 305830]|uniref:Single-strand DNA deaminase toxin A-like C-terminal domain-containing protein n=1 Tax=Serendipita vermifera MAFF 305830 TaxID=933852 RepID=A0A0C3AXR2_SERVB|nr:hypothetical protein M408DRAFT_8343 [Serendipita vermifera MAFF 305830]
MSGMTTLSLPVAHVFQWNESFTKVICPYCDEAHEHPGTATADVEGPPPIRPATCRKPCLKGIKLRYLLRYSSSCELTTDPHDKSVYLENKALSQPRPATDTELDNLLGGLSLSTTVKPSITPPPDVPTKLGIPEGSESFRCGQPTIYLHFSEPHTKEVSRPSVVMRIFLVQGDPNSTTDVPHKVLFRRQLKPSTKFDDAKKDRIRNRLRRVQYCLQKIPPTHTNWRPFYTHVKAILRVIHKFAKASTTNYIHYLEDLFGLLPPPKPPTPAAAYQEVQSSEPLEVDIHARDGSANAALYKGELLLQEWRLWSVTKTFGILLRDTCDLPPVCAMSGYSPAYLPNTHRLLEGAHYTQRMVEICDEIGYSIPVDSQLDRGNPSYYYACHAEMQLLAYYIERHCNIKENQLQGLVPGPGFVNPTIVGVSPATITVGGILFEASTTRGPADPFRLP